MNQRKLTTIALAILLITGGAESAQPQETPLSDAVEILGNVTSAAQPVGSALVVALNLTTFYAAQTLSNQDGFFRLPPLQLGVYRIIAVKQGFAPAIATILPTGKDQRLAIRLTTDKHLTQSQKEDIWQIRSALPKDVLREIDSVLSEDRSDESADHQQRFAAEMVSMAGLTDQRLTPALTRTAVGVRGDFGGGWQLDLRGDVHRLEDSGVSAAAPALPVASSSGVSMELHAGPEDAYRLQSTRSSWRLYENQADPEFQSADLESHHFEWQRRGTKVNVRYLAEENVFSARSNSELFEVSGDRQIMKSSNSRLGVSLSLGQESYVSEEPSTAFHRVAELSANGSYTPARSLNLQYGLLTRVAENGLEIAPQTGAEIRLGESLSFVVTGLYKIHDDRSLLRELPNLVFWKDAGETAPRYRYSVGVLSGDPGGAQLRAVVSIAEVDSNTRIVFDDRFEQLGDSLYLEPGEVRREITLAYQRNVGRNLAFDFSTSAGNARAHASTPTQEKYYVISDLRSLYKPSGTSIDVSYRQINQGEDLPAGVALTRERMNVIMGQSLHLPLDIRVLLGVELARLSETDSSSDEPVQRRYLGGLSFSF